MRFRLLVVLLLCATCLFAQESESLLPSPPSEISGLLELLDALEIAERAVLEGGRLPPSQIEELRELTSVADGFAAEDLGARARSLLFIAETGRTPLVAQPELDVPLGPATDSRLVRGTDSYRTLTTIVGATGASALALSTLFYILAERDYQRYLAFDPTGDDSGLGEELFQAWRGYDILGISMGAVALVAGGTIPLLFALAEEPTASAVPLTRPAYTPSERRETLDALYAERASIVTRLNELGTRGPRRERISTIGLTVGLVGTVTSFTMFYLADESYEQYVEAPFSSDAETFRSRVQIFDVLALTSGVLAAGGFGTVVGIEAFTKDREELEAELRAINARIIDVRTAPIIGALPAAGTSPVAEPTVTEEESVPPESNEN